MVAVRIGTSGFTYRHWFGPFYPEEYRGDLLAYYARFFNTVEVNASFYGLLPPKSVAEWLAQVPPDFLFTFKGSRYITHIKRLRAPVQAVERFYASLAPAMAQGRVGAILWQLPPSLPVDLGRLQAFLELQPPAIPQCFEFRHPSWIVPEVEAFFASSPRVIGAVQADAPSCSFLRPVGTIHYFRRHGPQGLGAGCYSDAQLQELADAIDGSVPTFVYFNNDAFGYAPANARKLQEICRARGLGV